jgi:hypothetical protein
VSGTGGDWFDLVGGDAREQQRDVADLADPPCAGDAAAQVFLEGLGLVRRQRAEDVGAVVVLEGVRGILHCPPPISVMAERNARNA